MRSTSPLRRFGLAALLAAGALGLATGPAAAESLSWLDLGSHNVWAENVDGRERQPLTTDATDELRYSHPSVNDAGDLGVLLRDTRSGSVSIVVYPAQGPPIVNAMPTWGVGVTVR